MKKITKIFAVILGIITGITIAELTYYPAKRAVKKRHYITLRG